MPRCHPRPREAMSKELGTHPSTESDLTLDKKGERYYPHGTQEERDSGATSGSERTCSSCRR